MTGAEAIGVGLGFLAIVAPEFWPKMPRALSYTLAGIGLSWLTYSLILGIESLSHIKLQYGPLGVIILGAVLIAGGLFWHISRLGTEEPAQPGHSQTTERAPLPIAPGILLDVAFDLLPRISPPDGTIHIFEIREETAGVEASLVENQFSGASEVIDWKLRFPEWPVFGISKCEITSTTSESVFDARIPLNLKFREMIPDTPGLPSVEIGGAIQSINGIQMRSGRVMMTQQSSFTVGRIYPQNSVCDLLCKQD